jgi:hypothetical protein
MFLRNVGIYLQVARTALQPRRPTPMLLTLVDGSCLRSDWIHK